MLHNRSPKKNSHLQNDRNSSHRVMSKQSRSRSMDLLLTNDEIRVRKQRRISKDVSLEKNRHIHRPIRAKSHDRLLNVPLESCRRQTSQSMACIHNTNQNKSFNHPNKNRISLSQQDIRQKRIIHHSPKKISRNAPTAHHVKFSPLSSASQEERKSQSKWIDSYCGIAHLLVVATSLLTTIPMGLLSSQWQMYNKHCPLFVSATSHEQDYWGNNEMSICFLCSYLPLIILLISLAMAIFHGSILQAARTRKLFPPFLNTRSYAVIMSILNASEFIFAIGIAATITDGFRQTCLSFQLSPWIGDRADTCKEGFDNRDYAYFIGGSFNRIVIALFGAWLSVIFLLQTFVIFLWKTKICSL